MAEDWTQWCALMEDLAKSEISTLANRMTTDNAKGRPLVQVSGLKVEFELKGGQKLIAVDGVDLHIETREVIGLVGESGCGKTVFALSMLRLIESYSSTLSSA